MTFSARHSEVITNVNTFDSYSGAQIGITIIGHIPN